MKQILISALVAGSIGAGFGTAALAEPGEGVDARLAALEKENAAIRRENAALRENRALNARNASLKSQSPPQAASQPNAKRDVFAAYAADLPVAYKARPIEPRGQFRVWGEGGAIWSGGDRVTSDYTIVGGLGGFGGFPGASGSFDLTPKIGWEAATGFDYRFANSPWHVSGQFRYGEGGKVSGAAASAAAIDPFIVRILVGSIFGGDPGDDPGPGSTGTTGGSVAVGYREKHWLADIAVGYDILGSGPDAMQVKFGLRLAEFTGTTDRTDTANTLFNFGVPLVGGGIGTIDAIGFGMSSMTAQRSSFFGAGPRIGIEGSAPLGGGWAFDYIGDVAVLFGNQRLTDTTTTASIVTPAILGGILGGGSSGSSTTTTSDQRFATVFNADLQAGVSYFVTPNVKVSASYRLDAYFGVLNTTFSTTTKKTLDRYIHGPRLGLSATF